MSYMVMLHPRKSLPQKANVSRWLWLIRRFSSRLDESRKCLKRREYAAITNRLLYQLSYVGLHVIRGTFVLNVPTDKKIGMFRCCCSPKYCTAPKSTTCEISSVG